MKFLVFSDLHAHNHEQFSRRLKSGRNSRLQDCLNIIDQVNQIATEQKVDVVLFLGDLFHSRTKLDIDVLTSVVDRMNYLGQCHKTVALVGNHDQYTKVGEINSLSTLKHVDVISSPEIKTFGAVKIAFYPHTVDVPAMKDWINKLDSSVDMFCFHQGISEASIGAYDAHIRCELALADLPLDRCKIVMAGDFHKRQFLASGKFHYIGSPLQLTFAEKLDIKCFSLIDTDTWHVTNIPTNAPTFHEFETYEKFEKQVTSGFSFENKFVRLICTDADTIKRVRFQYPTVQVVDATPKHVVTRNATSGGETDLQLLKLYAERNLDKPLVDEYVTLGLSLLAGGFDE